jgi:hypothetical protein
VRLPFCKVRQRATNFVSVMSDSAGRASRPQCVGGPALRPLACRAKMGVGHPGHETPCFRAVGNSRRAASYLTKIWSSSYHAARKRRSASCIRSSTTCGLCDWALLPRAASAVRQLPASGPFRSRCALPCCELAQVGTRKPIYGRMTRITHRALANPEAKHKLTVY